MGIGRGRGLGCVSAVEGQSRPAVLKVRQRRLERMEEGSVVGGNLVGESRDREAWPLSALVAVSN
jgi:hypothetical protein